jgi:zinc protease
MSQRLQGAARGSDPVFTSARIGLRPFVRGFEQFSADITLSKAGLDAAAAALARENARVREFGFTEPELDRARKSLLRAIEQAYNERDKTESAALANLLIRHVVNGEPAPGIEQEYVHAQAMLPQITLAELNDFARRLFNDSERKLIIYQGAQKTGEPVPTPDMLLAAVNVRPTAVAAYTERAVAGSLMDRPPEGGRIVAERQLGDLGVTELTLGNGVKVLLKPTDFKNDQVLLAATRPGGGSLFDDAELDTLRFVPGLLSNVGVRDLAPSALQRMFAGKSVQFGPYLSEVYEGFRGQSGSADAETMLQLAYLYVTKPHFNPALLRGAISRQQDGARNALARPETVFQAAVNQALFNGHPRAPRLATPEDYDRIRVDRIADIYSRRFSSARDFTYILVGSFELDKMSIAFMQAELDRLQVMIAHHIDSDPDMRNKKELLETIPGVGPRVSDHMTALFAGRTFNSAEQLAAYLGLVPVQWESGSSVKGRPRLSKAGPAHLRKLLYMPAIVATRHNPHIKALTERLLAKGKTKMAALGAAMRKLAHLCFGVIRSGKPYDPQFAL